MSAYLERFGAVVRDKLAIPGREFTDSSLKLNVLAVAEVTNRRQRLQRRLVATSAVAVACASALTVSYLHRATTAAGEKPIEYRVAGSAMPAPIGKYVAPLPKQPLALRFSEGSVVELEPGARARVARTTTHGATVLIETGGANVNVVHRPATDWTILAGPYTVHVTGTAFNLDFEASSQRFELKMQSGVVSVEGPGLSHPVEVRRDQKFVHYVGDPNFERREGDAADSLPATEVAAGTAPDVTTSDAVPASDAPVVRKVGAAPGESSTAKDSSRDGWAADVARGEYASVLRKAKAKGWPQVLEESNTADLMAVANAARFLGRTDSSREALDALRRRFKGTFAAQSATYLLGRLVEPSNSKEAINWYLQYEREAPNGALVAEAAGRRLLLLQAAGDRSGTERLAREYVSRFPDGPYAGVARKIVLP